MTKEEAIKFVKQMAEELYQRGTITMTPQAHQVFLRVIQTLESEEPKPEIPKE